MHSYIPHLLQDIENAKRLDVPPLSPMITFEDEWEALERWCEGEEEPEHNFGYYCSLKPENFPPSSQLSLSEIELINHAFQKMMYTWNLDIDLPKAMPAEIQYDFIIDSLNEKFTPINDGFITIDFCTGYAPDCKLKEYCPCLEIGNSLPDQDDIKMPNENDLLF